jgi:lipoprotein LprG
VDNCVDRPGYASSAWQAVAVRRLVSLLVALVLGLSLAACKGSDPGTSDKSPQDRLATAKKSFDNADYIEFTLTASSLPDGLQGLLSAQGTGTHDPAFTGEVKVQTKVTDLTAPLVAVDSTVYAKFPFVGWNKIDPSDYGAPDPANLMDPGSGVSSLFPATEHPQSGDSQRSGDEVLTTIDGTLPASAVKRVFPSSGDADFTVSYTLRSDDSIHSAKITGPFYDGSDDVTYTISFDLEADKVDIQAPA